MLLTAERPSQVTELVAQRVLSGGRWADAWDHCTLTYDERFLRRRVLHTVHRAHFLVDLPKTTSVDQGDAFELSDGRCIEIVAAQEDLFEVTGPDLVRLAWHIE